MGVNTRIVATSFDGPAALVNPAVSGTPAVQAAVLVDGAGNVIKAVDNGDGTATLSTTGGGGTTSTVKILDAAGTNQAAVSAAGAVKVDGSAVTQPVSGTVTATQPAATTTPTALTGTPPASQVVAATAKDYRGFTLRETAGSTALVVLWDNASAASGTILEAVALGANESTREFYSNGGVKTTNGIYAQVVSGNVAGSVRTG